MLAGRPPVKGPGAAAPEPPYARLGSKLADVGEHDDGFPSYDSLTKCIIYWIGACTVQKVSLRGRCQRHTGGRTFMQLCLLSTPQVQDPHSNVCNCKPKHQNPLTAQEHLV